MAVAVQTIKERAADVSRVLALWALPNGIVARAVPSPLGVRLVFDCPFQDQRNQTQYIALKTLELPIALDDWQHSLTVIKAKIDDACTYAINYFDDHPDCPYLLD